ncbi:hypothetical protein [Nocardia sp. XZ_19_369]|uniref:hypothetical protein n=1 Tax=Nocardia sp. XZ_19_369 TaxID=2769487 RepID=UPI0018907C51|nr:hypothetical protein [Nocardia sp. XZ_19_369]
MENIARTVEAIGGVITALGLTYAYMRARGALGYRAVRARRIWRLVMRRPQSATVHATAAAASAGALSVDAYALFNLDRSAPVQDQLDVIAEFCRSSQAESSQLRQRLAGHDREFNSVRGYAKEVADQAQTEASTQLKAFGVKLDSVSALDLRCAIVGVVVNTVGVCMGYWA